MSTIFFIFFKKKFRNPKKALFFKAFRIKKVLGFDGFGIKNTEMRYILLEKIQKNDTIKISLKK